MIFQKTELPNGLRLITAPLPYTRSVCLSFFIGAGSRYEREVGVAHFVEHLLFKGTQKRATAKELSQAIEGVGGILNGGTDKEMTLLWSKVARSHFYLALDVLSDMLLNPKFETQEVEKERQVIIDEINLHLDNPSHRVDMLIDELLWPGHPLGREVVGTKEMVSQINRNQLLEFFSQYYIPNNTVLSIAGNIKPDEVIKAIEEIFSSWQPRELPPFQPVEEQEGGPRFKLERKDIEQVHLCLGLRGVSYLHPDRFALDLLNILLGEGMSSRLFLEIREKKGLAYSIHSYTLYYRDTGCLIIGAGIDPKRLDSALHSILEELEKIKEEVPEEEVSRAKEFAKGRLLLRMEDTRNVANWAGGQELLIKKILSVDEVLSIIDSLTPSDLKRVAGQLFRKNKLFLAIVGPPYKEEKIAQLLEGF